MLKRDVQILEISKIFSKIHLKNLQLKINDINNHLFVSDIVIIEYILSLTEELNLSKN